MPRMNALRRPYQTVTTNDGDKAVQAPPMNTPYPLSDHYDGQRFFNPGVPPSSRGLLEVLRWRLRGERTAWPKGLSNHPPHPPPPPNTVPAGSTAITFINHASFLIRCPGALVLTDPIFSERCSPVAWAGPRRVRPPGIALRDLPRPDIVLLSHNHYDHMDLPSLREIQRRHAPGFVTTLGNAPALRHLGIVSTELDWWQHVTVRGLRVTATPARHFSARTPFDRNRTLWAGFMIQTDEGQILFAGDSGMGSHWRDIRARLGPPGIALLPVGAYEPRWFMAAAHMNPAEAVQAHHDLGAHRSVGMHFGTFQLTDEAIDAPLQALTEARDAAGLQEEHFTTQGFGETRIYRLRPQQAAAK
jgi:L-ascorbate metabolism protein UlaG (beta-lactamase superfamily)